MTDAIGHSHRRPRGTPRRLLLAAAVLAAGAVAACGSADEHAAIVAQPSAPAASSTSTELPSAHAVGPAAGEDEHSATSAPASTPKAATAGSSTARSDGNAILSPADRASFDRLRAAMGGTHGLAVSALGLDQRVEQLGPLRTAVAWSTAKVPLAMAVIARGGAEAQTANLRGALTASDNAAAMRLWASLGGGQTAAAAADEQLRDGGDAHTSIQYRALRGAGYTPFGQTDWALTDQARFAAGLACSAQGVQVIGFMNQVVSSQRWGLGAAGVPSQFKGGWGPGVRPGAPGGFLDRQMGVLVIHGRPLAVALASVPADGSHPTGINNLTTIARWLVAHADVGKLPSTPRC